MPLLFSCPSMKHGVDDSLINHNVDIIIQNYPNTLNARWQEGKSIDVIKQNDWSDSEICDVWSFESQLSFLFFKHPAWTRLITLPLTKKHHNSVPRHALNSVIINIFYFIFIKCRTNKNHVHIESFISNRVLVYLVWPICIEFVITCIFVTQFTYVILLICCTNSRTFKYMFHC